MRSTTILTTAEAAALRAMPLCGNYECNGRHNSRLDERDDVVLYSDCRTGTWHLFRADNDHGLIVGRGERPNSWTLTKETYTHQQTETGERWTLIPAAEPVCVGEYDPARGDWYARHLPSGRVIARRSGQFGLMASAARFYLRATAKAPAADDEHDETYHAGPVPADPAELAGFPEPLF